MTATTRVSNFRRAGLKTWLPALLFIVAVILAVVTTWNATMYCLDGDASSELVLANHLSDIGKPVSTQWFYSSEIRVLNTQLVFAPLFSLFSDWHMVRFTGAMILQALLVSSFFYLCKQARLSAGAFFLGASLLLMPVSTAYGRFVLYHSYYMPHIMIGIGCVSLLMSTMRHLHQKHWLAALIRFALLCAQSMLSGMGGIRQGVVTHVPLLFLLVVLAFQYAKDHALLETIRKYAPSIVAAGCALFAFLVGYLVNIRYFANHFVFGDYHNLTVSLMGAEKLPSLLFGVLHTFGFRDNIRVLSVLGILSLSAIFSFGFFAVHGIRLLVRPENGVSPARRFIGLFGVSGVFVMLCVFLFVDYGWYYPLYILPVTIWFVPLLAVLYDEMPDRASELGRADVCLLLTAALLTANGLCNSAFFATNGRLFPQRYEGVGYEDMTLVKKLEKPVEFLLENGYELGYSQFWSSNTVTEMSDGKIKMINLLVHQYDRPLVVHDLLMLRSTFDMETDKVFLLLPAFYNKAYVDMEIYDKGELVYDDGAFYIYHFDDPSILKEYTSW